MSKPSIIGERNGVPIYGQDRYIGYQLNVEGVVDNRDYPHTYNQEWDTLFGLPMQPRWMKDLDAKNKRLSSNINRGGLTPTLSETQTIFPYTSYRDAGHHMGEDSMQWHEAAKKYNVANQTLEKWKLADPVWAEKKNILDNIYNNAAQNNTFSEDVIAEIKSLEKELQSYEQSVLLPGFFKIVGDYQKGWDLYSEHGAKLSKSHYLHDNLKKNNDYVKSIQGTDRDKWEYSRDVQRHDESQYTTYNEEYMMKFHGIDITQPEHRGQAWYDKEFKRLEDEILKVK